MDSGLAHLVSWSEPTKGDVPPPLTGPSVTISPLGAPHPPAIFLFGGKSVQTRRLTSEMWVMDVASRVWEKIDAGEGPGPRYFHSMDVWEDKLVCFGGMSDSEPMSVHNDIWFFDCPSRRWLPQPYPSTSAHDPTLLPSARYAHLSAITHGRLVVSGGQHSDNSWIYEINVFDLKRQVWVSKTVQPEMRGQHSKGAYRSVTTSARQRVIHPPASTESKTMHSYSIDEDGEGGDIYCYSNYDFAKVRRELDVFSTDLSDEPAPSDKHVAPPSFVIRDDSATMRGSSQPPGLRFPTGGIVGNHLILCGLYFASSSAAFSIWALNLGTMTWKHLEPQILGTGSWNRAIVWPEQARILVFGNIYNDLATDYSRRAVHLDHVAVISLEAYGIYQPPKLEVAAKAQQVGLTMLDEKLASDFEVISEDGRRIKCSRKILSDRWAWFAAEERELSGRMAGLLKEEEALDINDTLLGSFTPARLTPTTLNIPEPFPVCVALVQYFYTLSLSTSLQNRAPVLSALLFLAKQYKIERLAALVVHALHERLEPAIAVGIYEIATLAGEQNLQIRALNMIHAAKASSSRSAGYRQGPSAASVGEGSTSTPSNAPTTSTDAPSSSASGAAGPRSGPIEDVPFRRARADSLTVPMDIILAEAVEEEKEKDDPQVHALMSALDVQDLPRRRSSISVQPRARAAEDDPILRPSPGSSSYSRLRHRQVPPPPTSGPPLGRLPIPPAPAMPRTPDLSYPYLIQGQRPSSPTNSEATSSFPQTPSETMRDSWLLPHSLPMESRSPSSSSHGHFGHGHGLEPLPEAGGSGGKTSKRPVRGLNREAMIDGLGDKYLSSETLEAAGLISMDTPPTSYGSQQARKLAQHDRPSLTSVRDARKLSVISHSSGSSQATSHKEVNLAVPGTPSSADFDISLGSRATSSLGRVPSAFSGTSKASDGFSISSGSTGTSSKKAAKAEMKAIREAEKDAKKAEAQAKFEALRAQQARRMALDKAEAQRKAEIAKNAPAPKKKEAKSKWGKLGQGFTDAVLFPSGGGEKTTIF